MDTPKKQFVLSHVATNVSKLTEASQFSPLEEHFNVPWRIGYRRREGFLRIILCLSKPGVNGKSWSIATKFTLKFSSINGKHFTASNEFIFESASVNDGYAIPMQQLNIILENYVVDDKLILEAHVTIERMEGVEKPANIRNFDAAAKEFSDLVLKVEGEKFYVSRLTLALQSTYFKSLLMGKFKEGNQTEVKLKDINPADFQNFLELCYMDPTLTDSNIMNVLMLVDMYEAKNGERVCEQFLIAESKHSLRNKLRIAVGFRLEKLKKHCLDNLKCLADIRAVMGSDLTQWDPSVTDELFEKSMGLMCLRSSQ